MQIFLVLAPLDMRLSFDRLSGLAKEQTADDALCGALSVFSLVGAAMHSTFCLFRMHGYLHQLPSIGPCNLPQTGTAKRGERRIEADDAVLKGLLDSVEMSSAAPLRIQRMAH